MQHLALLTSIVLVISSSTVSAQSAGPITEERLYVYRADVTDVYDGDSITATVDLGFSVWLHGEKFRLHGIDAPEMTGDERAAGEKARDFLRSKILGKRVFIQSLRDKNDNEKNEKYGRYLAIIWLDGANMNELMIKEGFAEVYK
jgi:micrococcal nuclease